MSEDFKMVQSTAFCPHCHGRHPIIRFMAIGTDHLVSCNKCKKAYTVTNKGIFITRIDEEESTD